MRIKTIILKFFLTRILLFKTFFNIFIILFVYFIFIHNIFNYNDIINYNIYTFKFYFIMINVLHLQKHFETVFFIDLLNHIKRAYFYNFYF
jgi:hypothetical protein